MHIYVDYIKLNVYKLESVYIINQIFGNGIIKYKGRILKPENNFLYYGIEDGCNITFNGLKGGGSKIYAIIFTVIVILIFIILLLSGFITVLSNIVIGSVKCILLNSLQTINYCNNKGSSSKRILPTLLTLIINIIFLILIFMGIYLSVYSLATITGLLVFYSKSTDSGSTLNVLCKNAHSSSKIGFWTAATFSMAYILNRLPSALYIISEMNNPISKMFSFMFYIPLKLSEKFNTFSKTMALSLFPMLMVYAESVPGMTESLYDTISGLDMSTDGQKLKGQVFNCNNPDDLIRMIEILFDESPGIEEKLDESGIGKYVKLFKLKLANIIINKKNNSVPLNTEYNLYKDSIDTYNAQYIREYKKSENNPISYLFGDYSKANMSEYIVCQLIGAISILNKYRMCVSPDPTDTSDMIISGVSSGLWALIAYSISMVYYGFIKSD